MIYEGQNLTVSLLDNGFAELVFDAKGSVNKFDRQTISDLDEATQAIAANSDVKGVVVRSAKPAFIVGADITEFTDMFAQPEEEVLAWVSKTSKVFDRFEDLPVPTVAAVNGFALGGGCEMALACDLRVVDTTASIGLPEVKLGLMPGFGGTVRLPRLIGSDNALEWMTTGKDRKGQQALNEGAVDAVVAPEKLTEAALSMVADAAAGKIDWQARRASKKAPLKLNSNEAMMSFSTAQAFVAAKAGKHYPAPHMMVETVKNASSLDRDGALALENQGFVKLAKTDAAKAQIGIFMADQLVKGKGKKLAKSATKAVKMNAVLGAGIMGGGIAYQSAVKGLPVVMKDINQPALDLGLSEAAKILNKGMQLGKVTPEKMAKTLNAITPSLEYSAIKDVDLVIEAVVENPKVKSIVLKETEQHVDDDTILCSNTSTISINQLAESLEKPERFCGMHFFNPVHMMPLVEVIRGEKTSDETVGTLVAYAQKMGKTPIVVNDCPGFLVNRVLFPYFGGFGMLMRDGADFQAVDKVMQKFGWPMGPAYLMDVVGIDTGVHAAQVMAEGFPERMQYDFKDVSTVMFENERYGQKNGIGFYKYELDKKGKTKKVVDESTYELIKPHVADTKEFDADEIIARMMIPMCTETVRCLEDNIVGSAAEADMAMIYGIGFPPFRGGPLRYIDSVGVKEFVALCDKYAHLGGIYEAPQMLKDMAAKGESFFA
jgi:3-hydroxyacyl-CoA dehydrogenase/enoyl-CoA hydratase/3-hydroxybutyryl-CoA epimerase/enoyl-CoA isomerase